MYRYFENKHRLLLYILNWYWCYLEFLVDYKLQNVLSKRDQLKAIVDLITHELPESTGQFDYNKKFLNHIVITESSKVYLVKEVAEINKDEVFKPYKDLCAKLLLSYQRITRNTNIPDRSAALLSKLRITNNFLVLFTQIN